MQEWCVPAAEVDELFGEIGVSIDGWLLFQLLFEEKWQAVTGVAGREHSAWVRIRNQLIRARSSVVSSKLEEGAVYLCTVIQKLAEWGLSQPWAYDGLAHLESTELPTRKTALESLTGGLDEPFQETPYVIVSRWNRLKADVLKLSHQDEGEL
jgi:hypothetical protein